MWITISLDGNEQTDGSRVDRNDYEEVKYKGDSESFKRRKKNRNKKKHKYVTEEALPYNPRLVSDDISEQGVQPTKANWLGRFDRPTKKRTRRILL
jgi:hypothetical protein